MTQETLVEMLWQLPGKVSTCFAGTWWRHDSGHPHTNTSNVLSRESCPTHPWVMQLLTDASKIACLIHPLLEDLMDLITLPVCLRGRLSMRAWNQCPKLQYVPERPNRAARGFISCLPREVHLAAVEVHPTEKPPGLSTASWRRLPVINHRFSHISRV